MKRTPTQENFAMLDALFAKDPTTWPKWCKDQGIETNPDLPVCLPNIPPDAWVNHTKITPPPAIQRYLESEDTLTNHTIDMMEMAMERDFGVTAPWYIDSERIGSEIDENLTVDCFRLHKEPSYKEFSRSIGAGKP